MSQVIGDGKTSSVGERESLYRGGRLERSRRGTVGWRMSSPYLVARIDPVGGGNFDFHFIRVGD